MRIHRLAGGRATLALAVLAVSLFVLGGCAPKQMDTKKVDKERAKKDTAHNLSQADQQKIIKDVGADLVVIEQSRGDSARLEEALSGNALKNVRATMRKDAAAGKVKVRDWQNVQLSFKNIIKDIAGLSVQFDDLSYYVDAKTGKQLTKPQKAPFRFVLAAKKIGDHWKIHGIYESEAKDPKEQEKFRP